MTIEIAVSIWLAGAFFSVVFFSLMCLWTKEEFDFDIICFFLWPLFLSVFLSVFVIEYAKTLGAKLYALFSNEKV